MIDVATRGELRREPLSSVVRSVVVNVNLGRFGRLLLVRFALAVSADRIFLMGFRKCRAWLEIPRSLDVLKDFRYRRLICSFD